MHTHGKHHQRDDGKLDLQLNFMGLYGVDAPVPHYFTELVARQDEESEPLRAFLDVFCHRLYAQFYLAWKKYRPFVDLEHAGSPYVNYLTALSGNAVDVLDNTELGFSGSLGTRVRSATALAGMLSEYMNDVPVKVNQFVPRWVRLEQDSYLGAEGENALQLGDNTILGDAVLDVSGKIDVCIGPMDADEARSLLPGKQRALDLGHLIERYLDPTLTFDVVLKVQPSSVIAQRLGEDDMILGWSSWVGHKLNESYELRIPGSSFFIEPEQKSEHGEEPSIRMSMVA